MAATQYGLVYLETPNNRHEVEIISKMIPTVQGLCAEYDLAAHLIREGRFMSTQGTAVVVFFSEGGKTLSVSAQGWNTHGALRALHQKLMNSAVRARMHDRFAGDPPPGA